MPLVAAACIPYLYRRSGYPRKDDHPVYALTVAHSSLIVDVVVVGTGACVVVVGTVVCAVAVGTVACVVVFGIVVGVHSLVANEQAAAVAWGILAEGMLSLEHTFPRQSELEEI